MTAQYEPGDLVEITRSSSPHKGHVGTVTATAVRGTAAQRVDVQLKDCTHTYGANELQSAPLKPGVRVRILTSYYGYKAGTVTKVPTPSYADVIPDGTTDTHTYDKENLMPTTVMTPVTIPTKELRKGDIVVRVPRVNFSSSTPDVRFRVVKVHRKKDTVELVRAGDLRGDPRQFEIGREWLSLVERPAKKSEQVKELTKKAEELTAKLAEMKREEEVAAAQRRVDLYQGDQALLRAGLVRVGLLAQWDAKLTQRPYPKETSVGLLANLRKAIEDVR